MGKIFAHHTHHMTKPTPQKPLRQTMPTVAAWIDELREAFGADQINPSIKAGMDGQPTFWAEENGQQVGTKPRKRVEKPSCGLCHHFARPGLSRGYCGGRDDLPPAYGKNHPLRRLPEDGGATCPNCLHYSEAF